MDNKEAIEVLRKNYPSSNYTMLIEAVELSIKSLQSAESAQTSHNNARDEIDALANELEDFNSHRVAPYGHITEIVAKMRQLSPVA